MKVEKEGRTSVHTIIMQDNDDDDDDELERLRSYVSKIDPGSELRPPPPLPPPPGFVPPLPQDLPSGDEEDSEDGSSYSDTMPKSSTLGW